MYALFFRTYQGWLAVSPQGEGDGTLQVVPLVKESSTYMLLRPYLEDVSNDDMFCGAYFGKQHQLTEKWHKPLLDCLVSIPKVQPGDTVWWHPDLIHAVEKYHRGKENASVFYIGAGPLCEKNARYLVKQREMFLIGEAGQDFPQEQRETNYKNRATEQDLSLLGNAQMGFLPWNLDDVDSQEEKELVHKCNNIILAK